MRSVSDIEIDDDDGNDDDNDEDDDDDDDEEDDSNNDGGDDGNGGNDDEDDDEDDDGNGGGGGGVRKKRRKRGRRREGEGSRMKCWERRRKAPGRKVEKFTEWQGQSLLSDTFSHFLILFLTGRDMGVDVMILPKLAAEEDPGM